MSDPRVFIRPDFAGPDRGEGGIRRWVEAQHRYLPAFGVEVVPTEAEADVVACHAADLVRTGKPLVVHNHGLYATAEQQWSKWAWIMNSSVIELLRRADVATVPSRWVADQVARGMNLDARVLYGGVDPEEWEPGQNGGYVLWNKTRVDPVCDPTALNQLAMRNPGIRFVTTFGRRQANVQVTGKLPFAEARDLIRNAAVYLSSSRETFGLSTVEAMACGLPVLGWAFGGNLDVVTHAETGWLAPPGDYEALQAGLEFCLHNRDRLGAAGRELALGRFTWARAIEECAGIYREAAALPRSPKVSVIVTCHDLEQYLPDCLRSVQAQTGGDWECVVVDDCSPGNCEEIVADFAKDDPRFRYVKTPRNLYLAGARNYAIAQSKGRYLLPLDADDMVGERAVEALAAHLDKEPGDAVAYGAMEVLEPDGRRWVSPWPQDFSWERQMSLRPDGVCNQNQLPYGSMLRREVWRRTGGYRERCETSEDNDFWCRSSSFGFRPRRVTDYPTLVYRNRPESMSHERPWPDCTLWYSWARRRELTPFGSVGKPANDMSWPVKTYADPKVSVVIPVGPGHEGLVRDALDSVLAQTVDCWECVVVNDTGGPLDLVGYPWARVVTTSSPSSGPAHARNTGVQASRAPLFALLDADDWLMPNFLERCVAIQEAHGGYVYSDWFQINENSDHEAKQAPEFALKDLLEKGLQWGITGLYPKAAWEEVGGFDPESRGWEDWDFLFALGTKEVCGTRAPEPLWCYRYWSGQRRERGVADAGANARTLRRKWREYVAHGGRKLMACSGCRKGGGAKAANQPTQAMQQITRREATLAEAVQEGAVLMEYVGTSAGTQTIRGPRSGQTYRFGPDDGHRRRFVYAVDVAGLRHLPFLRAVPPAEPEAAAQDGNRNEPLPVRQAKTRLDAVAVGA